MTPESRLVQIPVSYRGDYKKRSHSRKSAIFAMCRECTGYDREAVRHCTDTGCPLFHFRPYQTTRSDG